jgi:hypothetical protein
MNCGIETLRLKNQQIKRYTATAYRQASLYLLADLCYALSLFSQRPIRA